MFIEVSEDTWRSYQKKDGFSEVYTKAMTVVTNQKMAGAAAGFFNPMIVARDLGLTDKSEVKQASISVEIPADSSPEDAAKAYTDLMG